MQEYHICRTAVFNGLRNGVWQHRIYFECSGWCGRSHKTAADRQGCHIMQVAARTLTESNRFTGRVLPMRSPLRFRMDL